MRDELWSVAVQRTERPRLQDIHERVRRMLLNSGGRGGRSAAGRDLHMH